MGTQYIQGQLYQGQLALADPVLFGKHITTTKGIVAGGGAPTVTAVVAGAGTGAAISAQVGTDQAGSFTLTAGTFPTIGTLCTVTFATPLPSAPASVNVTAVNTTSGTAAAVVAGATAWSTTGFSVVTNAALTLNSTYLMAYQVYRQT